MSISTYSFRPSTLRMVALALALYCFFMLGGKALYAAEDASTVEETPSEEVMLETSEPKLLQPKDLADSVYSGKRSSGSFIWSSLLFLFMIVVIVGFWIYTKRGGAGLRKLTSSNDLRIRETKPLGNRQFLLVVEYGEQRMLLGVAPGVINHLCYLEAPDDLSNDDLEDGASSNLVP